MPPLYGQYAWVSFSENQTQSGLGGSLEGWREFRVRWKSWSDVTVCVDGVESAWLTDEVPVIESSNALISSPGYDPETDYNTYVDFVAVREAATTEPFGVSWGAEEVLIGPPAQTFPRVFETVVGLSPAFSVSFRTRIKGVVGIKARFEEIL